MDDKSYFVSTEKKNNKEAKADCISKGAKLFEPRNIKHNTFVAHLSEKKGLSGFWVGIHDRKENEGKDLFDRSHNPSHSTLYPEVFKIKTIIVAKQKFAKMPLVYYINYKFTNP